MLLTRCIRSREIYSNLHWQTIVMLGCLIPLGTAMETTGTARFLAEYLVEELHGFRPNRGSIWSLLSDDRSHITDVKQRHGGSHAADRDEPW